MSLDVTLGGTWIMFGQPEPSLMHLVKLSGRRRRLGNAQGITMLHIRSTHSLCSSGEFWFFYDGPLGQWWAGLLPSQEKQSSVIRLHS